MDAVHWLEICTLVKSCIYLSETMIIMHRPTYIHGISLVKLCCYSFKMQLNVHRLRWHILAVRIMSTSYGVQVVVIAIAIRVCVLSVCL